MNDIQIKCVSSLTKVFPDTDLKEPPYQCGSALRNEVFSFQAAYRSDRLVKRLHVKIDTGSPALNPLIHSVGLVPSELPSYGDGDDFVLRNTPGLYPDPLFPITTATELYAYPGQWRSLWITLPVNKEIKPGNYPIRITLYGKDNSTFGRNSEWYGESVFTLTILPPELPKQQIPHTEWFSADCISTWYDLAPLSPPWWKLISAYVHNAAEHGINMLLTPVFTPPVETKANTERLTVQLVDISKNGSRYSFDFENLGKWISMGLKNGIEYFEMPHLFTQWGAQFTPKIIVREDNELQTMFGWHVPSESPAYLEFLEQFLPALTDYLDSRLDSGHVFFHISDEPGEDSLERYGRLSAFVKNLIGAHPIMDALSEYALFEKSTLTIPVTATDAIEPFIEKNVENLWAYYACLQYQDSLSNRFFALPSNRNRILGIQLYKHNIKGFLHWGYNHWYSGLSEKKINPFLNTDAGACFPSSDAYLVYPGKHGPVNSIRIEVLREAFQDHRALQLLESLIGRTETQKLLEKDIMPVTFRQYPHDAEWLLALRETINKMIAQTQELSDAADN